MMLWAAWAGGAGCWGASVMMLHKGGGAYAQMPRIRGQCGQEYQHNLRGIGTPDASGYNKGILKLGA